MVDRAAEIFVEVEVVQAQFFEQVAQQQLDVAPQLLRPGPQTASLVLEAEARRWEREGPAKPQQEHRRAQACVALAERPEEQPARRQGEQATDEGRPREAAPLEQKTRPQEGAAAKQKTPQLPVAASETRVPRRQQSSPRKWFARP
jgi:hypothetical protein